MKPDDRSTSFTFHKDSLDYNNRVLRSSRRKLQDRFESDSNVSGNKKMSKNRRILSNISLSDPRQALRNGADKISKTLTNVKISIGTFSQRFKTNTRRRQILQESPSHYVRTPRSKSRAILGRTPTKLYSPFGIESPQHKINPENSLETSSKIMKPFDQVEDQIEESNYLKNKKVNDIWNKENVIDEHETEPKTVGSNWNFLNRNSQSLLK